MFSESQKIRLELSEFLIPKTPENAKRDENFGRNELYLSQLVTTIYQEKLKNIV